MKVILILTMIGTLLFLPGSTFAETIEECLTRCGTEATTREADCPPADKDAETDKARAQCQQDSQNAYSSCISGCQQPAPTESETHS